jgi:hypothetical protein
MAITWTNSKDSAPKFAGLVLRTFRRDHRAMSDIYTVATFAEVWSDQEGKPVEVLVDTGFELDDRGGTAQVDATPETLEKWASWKRLVELSRLARESAERLERARIAANQPAKGKTMRVVKGRKVPKGTVGTVFFIRDGRVGLDVTGKRDARGYVLDPVWVDASYLEAV